MEETGQVLSFHRTYGFIARRGKPDVFVHWKAILRDGGRVDARGHVCLNEGDVVKFRLGRQLDGRLKAEQVRLVR